MVVHACLSEALALEALSLAGHWRIENLATVYDNNQVVYDGSVYIACSVELLGASFPSIPDSQAGHAVRFGLFHRAGRTPAFNHTSFVQGWKSSLVRPVAVLETCRYPGGLSHRASLPG